ncbi:MAG: outer membrane lipoprotein chaperone LolA [Succinatimonas sp.]|nr:outer membrane lipoprotein chaperone LolA [Succinatimonas sp.]
MKRLFKFGILLASIFSIGVGFASPKDDLKARLQSFKSLSCDFYQEVVKADGSVVSTSNGKLLVSKPDRLMMHTQAPDEQYLFTRENSVYFYDPFVNQLSIFSVADLNTAPFLLLNSDDDKLWDQYEVKAQGQSFTLKPNASKEFKEIELNFKDETFESLVIFMKDGNKNTYKLSSQSNQVNLRDFEVFIPEDAEVDDERRSY